MMSPGVLFAVAFAVLFLQSAAPAVGDVASWSPDGALVAYARDGDLTVASVPDLAVRCLVHPAGASSIEQIVWSPDGKQLAFVGVRSDDRWTTIWTTTRACSEARDLLPPDAPFKSPGMRSVTISTWITDHAIAFTHGCGPECDLLASVDADTRQYARYCAAGGSVHWAPDRKHAVAETHLGGLALVDAESAAPIAGTIETIDFCEPVLPGCEVADGQAQGTWRAFEAWSPDSRSVLLTRRSCALPPPAYTQGELTRWDIGPNREAPLAEHARHGAWSPAGDRLALLLDGDDGVLQLTLADADARRADRRVPLGTVERVGGRGPRALSERGHPGYRPLWSPDGHRLLVRDAERRLTLVDLRRPDEPQRFGDVDGSWSPDGARLVLVDRTARRITIVEDR